MAKKELTQGLTVKKDENFSEWYTQTVVKSGLAEYSAVSGCMVIRPLGYAIWETIKDICDKRLKKMGVKNCYFPLFIPENLLTKEAQHVEGFAPEVAWVTHGGNTELSERLAVRPTSEAIMYDSYSKWIKSHRDLPLKLAQWNNVVRWEFKHPTLLLRTREFLWVEGHTVYATEKECMDEIDAIMNLWMDVCENTLALYGLAGKKTEAEKFAGAIFTKSVEFFVPNGRMAQGPDAHYDGTNFAKAYDIKFIDEDEKVKHPHQNTWAITTRMIGVLVAVHSDDKGLVLPPELAPNKAVIVPIIFEKSKKDVMKACDKIKKDLADLDPILDDREEYSPGWKYNEWELKGIPIRIELGPKDLEKGQAIVARRDTGDKKEVKLADVKKTVDKILKQMQKDLLAKSKNLTEKSIVDVSSLKEMQAAAKNKKVAKALFCNDPACEANIKDKTEGITTRNILEEKKGKCVGCGKDAKVLAYFAKAY